MNIFLYILVAAAMVLAAVLLWLIGRAVQDYMRARIGPR